MQLRRVKQIKPLNLSEERQQLMEKASTLFGGSYPTPRPTAETLKAAMDELGIIPFDPLTVRHYKESKEGRERLYKPVQRIMLPVMFLAAASLVASMFFPQYVFADYMSDHWAFDRFFSIVIAATVLLCSVGVRYGSDAEEFIDRKWVRQSLVDYGLDRIPDFVLDRAVALKTRCPQAEFNIVFLEETFGKIVKPHPDPFLLVKQGGDRFYIDVWNELDFERNL